MIAYVSAAFGDWREARSVQDVLIELGYVIEDDWTEAAEKDGALQTEHRDEIPAGTQREIAKEHVRAAVACDLHVLVCGPNFASCLGGIGEFFLAQHEGAQCHVIAPPRNSVFFKLERVQVFDSIVHWTPWISMAMPRP